MQEHGITPKVFLCYYDQHKDTKNSIATLKEFYLIGSKRKYPIPINFPGGQPERIPCGLTKECLLGSVTHHVIANAIMCVIKPGPVEVTGQRIASNIEACVQNKPQKYYQKSIKARGGLYFVTEDFGQLPGWYCKTLRRFK